MGEILGLGLSHYPGPSVPVESWTEMLHRNVEHGRIAPELFADKSRWPKEMRAEWGDDEGQSAAREHRRRLLAGYKRMRQELDAFKPDILLIWGDDQYENFKENCVPAFCVGIYGTIVNRPYGGGSIPFKTTKNAWGLPNDTELQTRGHYEASRALCEHLLVNGFDVAYSRKVTHPNGLAHSFVNTVLFLDYEREGFDYPIIPVHVNCYGNALINNSARLAGAGADEISPPSPSPARCFDIGRATARFFKESPWRVALIGSSSWSHASLTGKHGRLYPDIVADRKRHEDLRSGGFKLWGKLTSNEIEDAGQQELLNWICLGGAMTELGREAEIIDFVESYIFNSSKCFAIFPPNDSAGTGR
jgi:hypothetical protein